MVDLIFPEGFKQKKEEEIKLRMPQGFGSKSVNDDDFLGTSTLIEPTPKNPKTDSSITRMATALGTEIAIGEAGRLGGAAIAGPLGYIIGGISSGAYGSYVAQKMINPDNISKGRMLADAFINLIPGARGKKGYDAVKDAVIRQGSLGAAIGTGGVTVEKGFDEGRMPTIDELTTAGFTGALLGGGLGLTGAAFSKAYSKIEGLESRDILKLINSDGGVSTLFERVDLLRQKQFNIVKEKNKDKFTNFREDFDDEHIRTRLIQDESGGYYKDSGPLKTGGKDELDYYAHISLSEQKIKEQTDVLFNSNKIIDEGLVKKGADIGRTSEELSKDLDTILHAKYAPEVNKRLNSKNGSGMTDEVAKKHLDKFKKNGVLDLLDLEIKELSFLSKKILDKVEGGGLVSKEQAAIWRKERPDYVPLNRIIDETDIPTYFNSRNATGEVKTTGIRQLKGSILEVGSIRQNINESLAQTIRRAEVNKAKIAFKKLLDANRDVADQFVHIRKDAQPYFKQIDKDKFQDKVTPSDTTLSVFENGEKTLISFKDANLALAFKGKPKVAMDKYVEPIFNAATWINRNLGSLYTRYSPEFMIPNLSRDRTEAFVNVMTKQGYKNGAREILNPINIAKDMKTVYKMEMKGAKPTTPEEIELSKLYKEFKKDGGAVGGYGLSTVQQVEDKVASLSNMAKDGSFFSASIKQKAAKIDDLVNNFNKIFEDGTRFGTYRMMINKGYSGQKAAIAARNSSFDPTKGGRKVGALRAMYLFANPAIQANKVLFKNVFGNTGKFYGSKKDMFINRRNLVNTLGGMTAITAAFDQWNSFMNPEWREKIKSTHGSNWITNRNLVIVTGTKEDGSPSYFSLPIGYSLVPLKVAMDKAQQFALGNLGENPGDVAKEVGEEFFDTLSPFGGSIIPTVVRPYFELQANEDGLGRVIRPEWLETRNQYSTETMYPWTMDTYGGELAFALADTAKNLGYDVSPESLKYLAGNYFGGPGQFLQKILNITSKVVNNEKLSIREIPIAKKFFGTGYPETYEKRAGKFSELEQIAKEDNTEKARNSRLAYSIFKKLEDVKPSERRKVLSDEMLNNPENINEAVLNGIKKRIKNKQLGLTPADVRVKSLTINKRAEFLVKELQNMTIPQIQKFIKEQKSKGILTKNVEEVLVSLPEFKEIKLRKTE